MCHFSILLIAHAREWCSLEYCHYCQDKSRKHERGITQSSFQSAHSVWPLTGAKGKKHPSYAALELMTEIHQQEIRALALEKTLSQNSSVKLPILDLGSSFFLTETTISTGHRRPTFLPFLRPSFSF